MTRILLTASLAWAALFGLPAKARAEGMSLYAAQEPATGQEASGRRVVAPIPPKRPHGLPTFIRGRLVCAKNVNRLLAHRGVEGSGSALALSFLSWGRPSGIQPGAVQVERRRGGGHVRVVSHHDGERWVCLNASVRRQAWVFSPCSEGRAISWRIA